MEGGGFEPPKAEPSDLQSDPFDHSGTPPKKRKRRSVIEFYRYVNCLEPLALNILFFCTIAVDNPPLAGN